MITLLVFLSGFYDTLNGVRKSLNRLEESWGPQLHPISSFLFRVYEPLHKLETASFTLQNLLTLVNQITFFWACEKVLVPEEKVTNLYSLLFYNTFSYCVSYVKEMIEREDWYPYVNITHNSQIKHLAMSATKIVLEWTKAVTFIMTVVFLLLVMGLERGLDNYKPTLYFTVFTLVYYFITEKIFVELILMFVTYLQKPEFENLEALWLPVILRGMAISLSIVFSLIAFICGYFRCSFVVFYLNIYLGCKDLYLNKWKSLNSEMKVLSQFRLATVEELNSYEDVCSVCLNPMKVARATPCHHFFHADCLRNCLKTSNQCPMCKRELVFT